MGVNLSLLMICCSTLEYSLRSTLHRQYRENITPLVLRHPPTLVYSAASRAHVLCVLLVAQYDASGAMHQRPLGPFSLQIPSRPLVVVAGVLRASSVSAASHALQVHVLTLACPVDTSLQES